MGPNCLVACNDSRRQVGSIPTVARRQECTQGLLERSTLSAFVVSADELGVWIDLGSKKPPTVGQASVLMLLKWDYFSTAVLDYKSEPTVRKRPAGFRS